MIDMQKLKLGTRKSKLALIQANIVSSLLKTKLNIDSEIVGFCTSGDKIKKSALYDIGGKGLFIKELEEALLNKEIDIAIHSLKDVPGLIDDRFEIAGMLAREDPRDVLVSKQAKSIMDLKPNAVIGSSSPRRIAYLKKIRPDLEIKVLRGNLDSRMNKIVSGEYDATFLAFAGLKRLYGKIDEQICNIISDEVIIPAVGQGVIGLEVLKGNEDIKSICQQINDQETFDLANIERIYLEKLDASCRTPTAAYAKRLRGGKVIHISFMFADDNWDNIVSEAREANSLEEAQQIAIDVATKYKNLFK